MLYKLGIIIPHNSRGQVSNSETLRPQKPTRTSLLWSLSTRILERCLFDQYPEYPMTQYIFLFTVALGMYLGAYALA